MMVHDAFRGWSRVWSAQLSRRACAWLAATLAGGAYMCAWHGQAGAERSSVLDAAVHGVTVSETDVAQAITLLRRDYQIPMSFITAMPADRVSVDLPSGTVRDVLDQLAARSAVYRWAEVAGHLIVFPDGPIWQTTISDVHINQVPRLEATRLYIQHLKRDSPSFQGLGYVFKGDLTSPVFTTPVSLSPTGTVLEHLVELLGTDRSLVFSIQEGKAGGSVFYFERVVNKAGFTQGSHVPVTR